MTPAPGHLALNSLQSGRKAVITAVHAVDGLYQRLTALGFRRGQGIEVIRRAAFRGPLHVRMGTTDVIIRGADAACIHVLS
ncbi:MAG: FeoA family protein [Rhodocyclaceae bacterium]